VNRLQRLPRSRHIVQYIIVYSVISTIHHDHVLSMCARSNGVRHVITFDYEVKNGHDVVGEKSQSSTSEP